MLALLLTASAQRLPRSGERRLEEPAIAEQAQQTPSVELRLEQVDAKEVANQFDVLSRELMLMEDLFKGGNGELVTFDAKSARLMGYSQMSIKLAEELTESTNALISASAKVTNKKGTSLRIQDLGVDLKIYPVLSPYLEKATARVAEQSSKSSDKQKAGESVMALSVLSEYYCGAFWRPLPSVQAPWRTFQNISNPASTLRSWGYHETPNSAGGGWTRPQTHMSWICGWQTFRDHAYPSGNSIREQNYQGFTPRGEPNPEVWRSGPWPYAYWPTYVLWWHQYGPGK
jgi:hypothetical protein